MLSRRPRSARGGSPGLLWGASIQQAEGQRAVSRALSQVVRHRAWINSQHLAVCRVPAPTFQERERAEFLSRVFAGFGHETAIDAAGNVVVPIVSSPRLPFLAVTAHMDTALAPSGPEQIRVGPLGTFRGPGVTDNGPGLAALIALARFVRGQLVERPARNLLLVANVGEEGEGDLKGIRHLVCESAYRNRTDSYLVVDGSSVAHITVSAIGCKRFELVIEGAGGHSWNDYGRANPIHAIARAIHFISSARLPRHPRVTVSVGVIEGGESVNAIPCVARAKIDVRSTESRGIAIGERIVRQAVASAARAEDRPATNRLTSCRLNEIGDRPAAPELPDNPVAECLKAVDRHLEIQSSPECASTDANIPLAEGIPAVAVGGGGDGGDAHSPHEWYDPSGRDLGLRRIILAIAAMLQGLDQR